MTKETPPTQKRQYFYPNEVNISIINGKRVATLKPDWEQIRIKNLGLYKVKD